MDKHTVFAYCLQETLIRFKDTHELKIKGLTKIHHAKRAGVAILRSDKIEFMTKVTWNNEKLYDEESVNPHGGTPPQL